MEALHFTLPEQDDHTFMARIDDQPHFYPYFHRHSEIQLTWVQMGEGTLVVDSHMSSFKGDAIFLIGSNEPHIFKSAPDYYAAKSNTCIRTLDIFFDADKVASTLLNIPELKKLKTYITQIKSGLRIMQNQIENITVLMTRIYASTKSIERTILFIELIEMLSSAEQIKKLSNYKAAIESENEGVRINSICSYILNNYEREISLEEVSRIAYMTPQAFCRFFKKHTRCTFVSYLNKIRINEACKLFMEDNFESISSIAYRCGYNSIPNFNRVFKTVTGQSPTDYISNLKEKILSKNFN